MSDSEGRAGEGRAKRAVLPRATCVVVALALTAYLVATTAHVWWITERLDVEAGLQALDEICGPSSLYPPGFLLGQPRAELPIDLTGDGREERLVVFSHPGYEAMRLDLLPASGKVRCMGFAIFQKTSGGWLPPVYFMSGYGGQLAVRPGDPPTLCFDAVHGRDQPAQCAPLVGLLAQVAPAKVGPSGW